MNASNKETPQPVDELPLVEVIREARERSERINRLDTEISDLLWKVQEIFRDRWRGDRPIDVAFPPWGKLAWSWRRGPGAPRDANRAWRLVVIDEEDCEELMSMPRQCRSDVLAVLPKLAERMGLRR